jgi:hypothetical protein
MKVLHIATLYFSATLNRADAGEHANWPRDRKDMADPSMYTALPSCIIHFQNVLEQLVDGW